MNDKRKPDICVVIPNYNGVAFIRRAIESVLQNDNLFIQIIVVDDASTDESISEIDSFRDVLTLLRFEKNVGSNRARNTGLDACSADYILFLDNDDFLVSGALPIALEQLKSKNVDVLLGAFKYATLKDQWCRQTSQYLEISDGIETLRRWLNGGWVPPCSVIWNSNFIRKIGGWPIESNYTNNQDGHLIILASMRQCRFLWSPICLGVYFQHDGERVSKWTSEKHLQAKYLWLEKIAAEAHGNFPNALPIIARFVNDEARMAYARGYVEFGLRLENLIKSYDIAVPIEGNKLHVALTKFFGLRRKEMISRNVRNFRTLFK